jgi:hypothetical protein
MDKSERSNMSKKGIAMTLAVIGAVFVAVANAAAAPPARRSFGHGPAASTPLSEECKGGLWRLPRAERGEIV